MPTACVAVLIYLNFFTSHVTVGRAAGAGAGRCCSSPGATWVHFTVGRRRYAMPLALSFVLIGFFLWLAENAATFLRAWQYPSQESVWTLVHAAKLGSWSLLVVVSIVLVAGGQGLRGAAVRERPRPDRPPGLRGAAGELRPKARQAVRGAEEARRNHLILERYVAQR